MSIINVDAIWLNNYSDLVNDRSPSCFNSEYTNDFLDIVGVSSGRINFIDLQDFL